MIVAALVVALALGWVSFARRQDTAATAGQGPPTASAQGESLRTCIDSVRKALGIEHVDLHTYTDIQTMCGTQIYALDSLTDFDIRREKFLRQELDERIILLMVVTITLSGVALAGFQLWGSYKLISAGFQLDFNKDSNLVIEQNRISVKSSTTGLLILTVSLAFFIVYVIWIYPAQEARIAQPQAFPATPAAAAAPTIPPAVPGATGATSGTPSGAISGAPERSTTENGLGPPPIDSATRTGPAAPAHSVRH